MRIKSVIQFNFKTANPAFGKDLKAELGGKCEKESYSSFSSSSISSLRLE